MQYTLEVDLDKAAKVNRALVKEKQNAWDISKVSTYKIECEKSGKWKTIANGTTPADTFVFPTAVDARKFRLSVEAPGRPAITAFQLFQAK